MEARGGGRCEPGSFSFALFETLRYLNVPRYYLKAPIGARAAVWVRRPVSRGRGRTRGRGGALAGGSARRRPPGARTRSSREACGGDAALKHAINTVTQKTREMSTAPEVWAGGRVGVWTGMAA